MYLILFILEFINASSQHLSNGSFEHFPFLSDEVGNWTKSCNESSSISWDSTERRTGKHSLLVHIEENYQRAELKQYGFFHRNSTCVYILKGYAKSRVKGKWVTNPNLSIQLSVSDSFFNETTYSRTWFYPTHSEKDKKGWNAFYAIITVSARCSLFWLEISINQQGDFWFDDLTLRPASTDDMYKGSKFVDYIDNFFAIFQQYSLYRDSINIVATRKKTMSEAKFFFSYDQCRDFINRFLSMLTYYGDNHSYLLPPQETDEKTSANPKEKPPAPSGSYLGNGIGYLRVPDLFYANAKLSVAFADSLQQLIRIIDSNNIICGWVIDLRNNTGGNFYPMAAGLGPILGNRTYIYNMEASGVPFSRVGYYDGKVYEILGAMETKLENYSVKVTRPYILKDTTIPVAILVSGLTVSSGESVVISFSGRPQTRILGEPTKGKTTSHYQTKLADNSWLFLARLVVADQNKKIFYKRIIPDEIINSKDDQAMIEKARHWILSIKNCL